MKGIIFAHVSSSLAEIQLSEKDINFSSSKDFNSSSKFRKK